VIVKNNIDDVMRDFEVPDKLLQHMILERME
jgi:hypothetical protein